MPKLSEEKINKRNKLYLKHKYMLIEFYKIFKGSFIQKQGREIALKLEYTYNKLNEKKEIEKVLYTANVYNKAIRELEELGLIKSRRYGNTNNKAICYTKPLLCMILNISDQTTFQSTSFSNTTNRIFDTNLFIGSYVLMHPKDYFKGNINTMLRRNEGIKILYTYFFEKLAKGDRESSQYYNLIHFEKKINRVKELKTNPQKKEKTSFDLIHKNDIFKYYDLDTMRKKDIYLTRYYEQDNCFYTQYALFCYESTTVEKIVQNIGDIIQTTFDLFEGIYKKNQFRFIIELYFLNSNQLNNIKNKLENNKIYYEKDNTNLKYFDYIKKELNINFPIGEIGCYDCNITNEYKDGNRDNAKNEYIENMQKIEIEKLKNEKRV